MENYRALAMENNNERCTLSPTAPYSNTQHVLTIEWLKQYIDAENIRISFFLYVFASTNSLCILCGQRSGFYAILLLSSIARERDVNIMRMNIHAV